MYQFNMLVYVWYRVLFLRTIKNCLCSSHNRTDHPETQIGNIDDIIRVYGFWCVNTEHILQEHMQFDKSRFHANNV